MNQKYKQLSIKLSIIVISMVIGVNVGKYVTKIEKEGKKIKFEEYYKSIKVSCINAYLEKITPTSIELKINNVGLNDIKIIYLKYNDQILYPKNQVLLTASNHINDPNYQGITFYPPKNKPLISKNANTSLTLTYEEFGQLKTDTIYPWKLEKNLGFNNDFLHSLPNYKNFSFIKTEGDLITFSSGYHKIVSNITFPANHKIIIPENTTLDFTNKAKLLSRSPIIAKGSDKNPITIKSSDKKGQGIVILNANNISIFKDVIFENLSANNDGLWSVSGAITIYESDTTIENCKFISNLLGDDYLNIIRSDFKISNSFFENVHADAFDSDFSTGKVENTVFSMVGNDSIDASGSLIEITNVKMNNIGDKGISSGERSNLNVKNVFIDSAEIGLTSKDDSKLNGENIIIQNSNLGLALFQKKPEYGPGYINVSNLKLRNLKTPFLLEKKSTLIIGGESKNYTDKNVKDKLYGAEYGKASK